MTLATLREEILIELENMAATVCEVEALRRDIAGRTPTVREKTAASAFLAQFYNGVENVLKRLSRFHGVPLPVGDNWQADLFKRFCAPPFPLLPALFDARLATALAPFRKFRHVVFHGYGFQIEWDRMQPGVEQVAELFRLFQDRVLEHLRGLEPPKEKPTPA